MLKNFDQWNQRKKELDIVRKRLFFKAGEIWWCSVGLNIADEVCGKGESFRRPALILKKLSINTCIILPLTSQRKIGTWFHEVTILNEKNWVLLHQIKMISVNRFQRRLVVLDERNFKLVKQKLEVLLELAS